MLRDHVLLSPGPVFSVLKLNGWRLYPSHEEALDHNEVDYPAGTDLDIFEKLISVPFKQSVEVDLGAHVSPEDHDLEEALEAMTATVQRQYIQSLLDISRRDDVNEARSIFGDGYLVVWPFAMAIANAVSGAHDGSTGLVVNDPRKFLIYLPPGTDLKIRTTLPVQYRFMPSLPSASA
jgi:hypothetical protein